MKKILNILKVLSNIENAILDVLWKFQVSTNIIRFWMGPKKK